MSAFNLPLLEWLDVPAGQVMLTDHDGSFEVAPFQIAKYPVTNAQFEAFIQDNGYKAAQWWDGLAQTGGAPRASDWRDPDCPKLEVCWYEAVAFGRWLADQTVLKIRLPTEWEWQWAAVGASGSVYPYGSVFDPLQANTKESGIGRTTAVTHFADAVSPFGAIDMAGNVWEWCLNEGIDLENCQPEGSENRALRGGSWNNPQKQAAATFRNHRTPRTRTFNIGFRLIVSSDEA